MKMTFYEKVFQVFLVIFLSLLCLSMVYPFLHQLTLSVSDGAARLGVSLVPQGFSLNAYASLFRTSEIWTAFGNSLFRTIAGTLAMMLVMSFAAYALSKKGLPHRKFFTTIIIMTMFFSGGLLPSYMLIKSLNLFDTRLVFILPSLINTFWLIIMRNFFMQLSEEIEESAKIDGANDIRIFWQIVIPVSMPIIATMILFCTVYHWNAWFDALMYTRDQGLLVLQIYLRRLIINQDESMINAVLVTTNAPPSESLKAAALIFTTVPILVVYPFLQKHFAQGILVGSVKG